MQCMTTLTATRRTTPPAPASCGTALVVETLSDDRPPVRRREGQTLLRVVSGIVRLAVDGEETLLPTGAEAIVPAGAAHEISALAGQARVMSGSRPA
jgi:quercetin dioxygenase-like cupin family protein